MNNQPPTRQRGIALVVVLVFLVLLSIFIIGFFSNSQDELTAAQSFTAEASASHLAESAVAVVMGQIREATNRRNGAWGSQPGMIRVYRSGDNASANPDAFFKLYSSNDMIVSGSELDKFRPTEDVAEGAGSGWNHNPALWTDLNEPAFVEAPKAGGGFDRQRRYPILDPRLEDKVEGLELVRTAKDDSGGRDFDTRARMPVRWLYVLRDGTLTAPTSAGADGTQAVWATEEKAPTPTNPIVGRIAFWTDDETSKVNVNTAGGYSLKQEVRPGDGGMPRFDGENKPYTEDSYAGSFWDTPRAFTRFEQGRIESDRVYDPSPYATSKLLKGGFALCQPVRGEFQRYPGHPATTSLGILFRRRAGRGSMENADYLLTSGQLALLTPRLQYALFPQGDDDYAQRCSSYGTERLKAYNDRPPELRVKRLYASVDELFYAQPDFDPKRTNRTRVQSDVEIFPQTMDESKEATTITAELLDQMRFFLTAHSRAPELNLFGRPRMTIWPVTYIAAGERRDGPEGLWNASDRLIAFCSTLGPDFPVVPENRSSRFILQRKDWRSPVYDSQSIERNRFLYSYLQRLTSAPWPGFGGTFENKFGKNDRDQVLTEIFDYIRVVNLRDSTRDLTIVPNMRTVTNPDGVAPNAQQFQQMEKFKFSPRGLVVPLKFGDTTGFGRFPGISEAALVLYHAGYQWGGTDAGGGTRKFLAEHGPKSSGRTVRPSYNLIRAFLVFETFNPMQGFAPIVAPNGNSIAQNKGSIIFDVKGLEGFRVNGKSLGFPAADTTGQLSGGAKNRYNHSPVNFFHGRNTGGSEGFFHTLYKPIVADPLRRPTDSTDGPRTGTYIQPMDRPQDERDWRYYQFQSLGSALAMGDAEHPGIPIPVDDPTINLGGTTLEVNLYFGSTANDSLITKNPIRLVFPDATVPTPYGGNLAIVDDPANGPEWRDANAYWQGRAGGFIPPIDGPNGEQQYWSMFFSQNNPPDRPPIVGPYISLPCYLKSFAGRMFVMRNSDSGTTRDVARNRPGYYRTDMWRQIVQPGDVIRSVLYSEGDLRASLLSNSSDVFKTHPDYFSSSLRRAQTLRVGEGSLYFPANSVPAGPTNPGGNDTKFGNIAPLQAGGSYPPAQAADLPASNDGTNRINGVQRAGGKPGDFDTGIGNLADGPYLNKPDEGNLAYKRRQLDAFGEFHYWHFPTPYFTWVYEETFDTFFTPNRQVPSAVLFGSLLRGKTKHWETLCFSPNPAGDDHPGRVAPKDYLWLDLFHMPIVEPYAISEPFSTAGKINMNYQIVPFGNIKRSTGMRAALQPVRVTAMTVNDVNGSRQVIYKTGNNGQPLESNYRYLVNRDETLKAFDDFFAEFDRGDKRSGFFKSAAQICDFYLYPKRANSQTIPQVPTTVRWAPGDAAIKTWWRDQALTGDNLREKPYADLYARLTTKSNTYCVHVRAQALRQSGPSDPSKAAEHYRTWNEKRDRIVGEYRGSSIIERYIDPQDARFDRNSGVDRNSFIDIDAVCNNLNAESFERAYRFRVLNTKRFDP